MTDNEFPDDEDVYLDPDDVHPDERLDVKYVLLSRIRPTKRNPNSMDEASFQRLKLGIQELGFVQPLVVLRVYGDPNADFEMADGHHRGRALQELDYQAAPVVVASSWSEAQQIIARIALNKNRGELNLTAVAEDVSFLHTDMGINVEELVATGYSESELTDMIAAMATDLDTPRPSDIAGTTVTTSETGAVNPRPFLLELSFASKDQRKAVRDALKRAGGGDMTVGLLSLAGIEE